MFQQLTLIALDAQTTLQVFSAPISMAAGETGTLSGTVYHADGVTPYNLTNCFLQLVVWGAKGYAQPLTSRQATVVSSGAGQWTFSIFPGDTVGQPGSYSWEIWLVDNNFSPAKNFRTGGLGAWDILPSNFSQGMPVTNPAPLPPVGTGPAGLGLTRVRVTSAATAAFLFWHACDPTAGSFTLTMPRASTAIGTANIIAAGNIGYGSGNTVTLSNGVDTFNGYSQWVLSSGDSKIWIASSAGYEALS